MPKFMVTGSMGVRFIAEVEADNEDEIYDMIDEHDFDTSVALDNAYSWEFSADDVSPVEKEDE